MNEEEKKAAPLKEEHAECIGEEQKNEQKVAAEQLEEQPDPEQEEQVGEGGNEVTDPEELLSRLKAKEEEFQDLWQRHLRLRADFDNFRKRARKDQEEAVFSAQEGFILGLLEVLDNFERALEVDREQSDFKSFLSGVEMIYRQFQDVLNKEGVSTIVAEGEPFDPEKHYGVMLVKTKEKEEGTVLEELQKGYTFRERVIRPSKVKVAKNE